MNHRHHARRLATGSLSALLLATPLSRAKLPEPGDEAKAKAAEAAAKTAWNAKVDAYQLCKAQNKMAASYRKTAPSPKPAIETPPCVDPGPFAYAPAAAPASATAAAPPASASAAASALRK